MTKAPDVGVSIDGHVATVTLKRPPHNFVDAKFLTAIAESLEALDGEAACRAVVLASEGKSFCAGADLSGGLGGGEPFDMAGFYGEAMRLFRTRKPIVAAVQGPAVGAGVGLALVADFRIGCPASRFSVNFNRLGFHPGFGLSFTLQRLIGRQQAALLFYTGRRINGEAAHAIGLVDELVPDGGVLQRAQALAAEIAISAPQAVMSTRAALRDGLADEVKAWNARELEMQRQQFQTRDFLEGLAAAGERRAPNFTGS